MVIAQQRTFDRIKVAGDVFEEDNSSFDFLRKTIKSPGIASVWRNRVFVAQVLLDLDKIELVSGSFSLPSEPLIDGLRELIDTSQSTFTQGRERYRETIDDEVLLDEPLDPIPIRTGTIKLHLTYGGKGEPVLQGNADLYFIDED